ncbi:Armadillo [Artemisia annua]|uniref:RING-type E3 ubiquitin transferase n=1 Tax=Artemisia annua TaxID=35608 RepID=A0A2U1MQ28_ARTAN|nr:Armadillo [Artemisia annua]
MAKSGVYEGDPTANITTLKKELQRLVKSIIDDEHNNGFDVIDQATQTLMNLKKLKSSSLVHVGVDTCPQEFKCPVSNEVMRDPVIISTGKTYDRSSIQKWLKAGNRTCPTTQQVLSHTILTPNHLVRDMITQWCKNHGVRLPSPLQYANEDGLTEADQDHFLSLLKKLSSSVLSEQKEAAKTLRSLTKRIPSFRAFFSECSDAITQLLAPLSQNKKETHLDLQEDLITTLLNLSILDNNKKMVAETPMVITILLDALRSGTIETRSNAAATLFTLSALDSNKSVIGKAGALKPLIDLLDEGHALAMKDAASAIFNLCIIHENKGRAVRDGAINVLLNKIEDRVQVDELLSILAMLSSNQKAIEDLCDLGAVSCLFSLMRETTCARNKENCVAILYTICFNDRTKWKEMREEESNYGTLSQVAQNGTLRAKRKAEGVLDRINRPMSRTHTA